jgi:hypothetical protein
MKIVGAVFADFVESNLGGPSHLRTELAGQTILARTLRRLLQVEGLAGRCLFVRERDRAAAEETLQNAGLTEQVDLVPEDPGDRPRRELVRAARKWCLESWRGNPLGLSWFDEFIDAPTVACALDHYRCDGVFCFDGHQPVLDPAIATTMLTHLKEHQDACKIVFTQAPPGLAGVILRREAIEDLLKLSIPFGLLLAYRPEIAQPDPIIHPSCCPVAPILTHTAARLTGDTRRSRELLELAIREVGEHASAEDLRRWLALPGHDRAGPLPVEVELELTTDDPLPGTTLRPRGDRVPRRQLADLAALERLARELAQYDDRLVVLGGHGDPLRHPQFADVLRLLRESGVRGVGVTTPLTELPEETMEAILTNRVDVLEVLLDAHSPATYAQVHNSELHARVVANVERFELVRRERRSPWPILVCSLTRCTATIGEMEAFYDRWIKALGSALIRGYSDYCGALPPDTLLPTRPPIREPCRRLSSRLMLLADGRVPWCSQDFGGETCLGKWTDGALQQIWEGPALQELRAAHAAINLGALPMCQRCREWFRP